MVSYSEKWIQRGAGYFWEYWKIALSLYIKITLRVDFESKKLSSPSSQFNCNNVENHYLGISIEIYKADSLLRKVISGRIIKDAWARQVDGRDIFSWWCSYFLLEFSIDPEGYLLLLKSFEFRVYQQFWSAIIKLQMSKYTHFPI